MDRLRRTLVFSLPAATWLPSNAAANPATEELEGRIVERARELSAKGNPVLEILAPEGCEANVQPTLDSFGSKTGLSTRLHLVPVDDVNTRLILAARRRMSYDLALPATYGLADLAEANAIQPLGGYQATLETDDPGARGLYPLGDYYHGQIYGFQTDGDVYVMFYNREILEDPQLSEEFERRFGESPQPARSFSDLDRLLAFYHRPSEGIFGGNLFRTPQYIAWEYWIRLHAQHVLPFDADMRPMLTTEGALRAAEDLANASKYLTPNAATASLTESWQTFAGGRVMCTIGWGGSQKFFRNNSTQLRKGVVTAGTPYNDIDSSSAAFSYFNWGWNFAVPSSAKQPELGFLLARYAVLPSHSTTAVGQANGFFDPFHAEHYQCPIIRKIYGTEFLQIHSRSMENALPDLYLRGQSQYMSILSDHLLQIDRREISPAAAMEAVAAQWEDLTELIGRSEQIRQWRLLLEQYPAATRGWVS